MRIVKMAIVAAALVGGSLVESAPASAAPVQAGVGLATGAPVIDQVQYWGGPGWGPRPYYGYGGGPRWRGGYGGGPRVVCRVRYTPWGPRRSCFRRW